MNIQFNTLISLLDDNDSEVLGAVTSELMKHGVKVIPHLEEVWESTSDIRIQERLENVIHYIQFGHTQTKIRKWIRSGSKDLLEGVIYLSQFQYPGIDIENIRTRINKIADDVYLSAGNHLTAIEKVKLLNYVMFEVNNFTSNNSNLNSPQNCFINQVLDTRKGNSTSLGVIYLIVAQTVGLPIYGVNLKKSFVLAYMNEYRQVNSRDVVPDILFYINPFSKGTVLNKLDIDNFITQQMIEASPEYYMPCLNADILRRLIMDLVLAFKKLEFTDKVDMLEEILGEFDK